MPKCTKINFRWRKSNFKLNCPRLQILKESEISMYMSPKNSHRKNVWKWGSKKRNTFLPTSKRHSAGIFERENCLDWTSTNLSKTQLVIPLLMRQMLRTTYAPIWEGPEQKLEAFFLKSNNIFLVSYAQNKKNNLVLPEFFTAWGRRSESMEMSKTRTEKWGDRKMRGQKKRVQFVFRTCSLLNRLHRFIDIFIVDGMRNRFLKLMWKFVKFSL